MRVELIRPDTAHDQTRLGSLGSLYQLSLPRLHIYLLKGWENVLFELGSERVKVVDQAGVTIMRSHPRMIGAQDRSGCFFLHVQYDASTSISTSHVDREDAQASVPFSCVLRLRRPGSHVAFSCAYACACVVRVNQPLHLRRKHKHTPRVNQDDASTGNRSAFLFSCPCACACVVPVRMWPVLALVLASYVLNRPFRLCGGTNDLSHVNLVSRALERGWSHVTPEKLWSANTQTKKSPLTRMDS